MASRVIVKNLPKHATEERLRDYFSTAGEVTDCRIKKTKDGATRNFGFVGFRRESEAQEAIKRLSRSFFDTSRIHVEVAHAPGAEGLGRAWSRYTPGSSKHKKETEAAAEAEAAEGPPRAAPAASSKAAVGKQKGGAAGKSSKDVAGEGQPSMQEVPEPAEPAESAAASKTGDDDDGGVSDLAWLKQKAKVVAEAPDADAAEADDGEPKKGKKKKKKGTAKGKKSTKAAADADADAEAKTDAAGSAEATGGDGDGEDAEDADGGGRIYVTNLPYGTVEDELRGHFEAVGEVGLVSICKDEDTMKSRGFGYVTYVFQENAIRAQVELDSKPFQGRMLRVALAKAKPEPKDKDSDALTLRGRTSSYKRNLELRKKRVDAHMTQTWNLLYVSSNAAADAAAAQMGVDKGELFGKDAENAALTAALAETSIIQQTKRWLQKEGIRVDAFEQFGTSLDKSKAVDAADGKRRDDSFIVKHLPAGASGPELRERFARHGELVRCSLAPSGTVGIVQYVDQTQAKRAFQKIAFSRYRHVPLYLEWAPQDVFTDEGQRPQEAQGGAVSSTAPAAAGKEELPDNEDEDESQRGCVFVKNLSFATTDAALRSAFSGCKGFRSAVVMRKKAATPKAGKAAQEELLSMGYGFVEFDTSASATEAMKRRQGMLVDGKTLQLQLSQRGSRHDASAGAKGGKKKGGPLKSPRLCVRNLAFETTRKELSKLFGHFGSVTAVRIPKKADYSGHRGFAFIDFASKAEAAAAYEALQHTHLYGRRMVIEPAEEVATDVGSVQESAQKRAAAKEQRSEARKRRRTGVLNAPGDNGAFQDAMM